VKEKMASPFDFTSIVNTFYSLLGVSNDNALHEVARLRAVPAFYSLLGSFVDPLRKKPEVTAFGELSTPFWEFRLVHGSQPRGYFA